MNVESVSANQYSQIVRPKPEEMIEKLLKNKDSDGDGSLNIEEFGSTNKDFFNQIDSDSDGLITKDEILTDMENQKAKMDTQLQSLDGESIFGMQRMPPPPPKPEEIFNQLDSNEDDILSIDELGTTEDEFSALDTNGDGVLSQEELIAFIDKQKAMMDAKIQNQNDESELTNIQKMSMDTMQNIFDILFNENDDNNNNTLNFFG